MYTLPEFVSLNAKTHPELSLGKHANKLIELAHLSIPIPKSFVITPQSFSLFASSDNLSQKILLNLKNADHHDPHALEKTARIIHKLIRHQHFNKDFSHQLHQHYKQIIASGFFHIIPSPTAHQQAADIPTQPRKGDTVLLETIRDLWAQQFTPATIRSWHSHTHLPIINLVVSSHAPAGITGTAYSINPLHQSKSHLLINAIYGEDINQDTIPDQYLLSKANYTLLSQSITRQDHYHTFNHHGKNVNKLVPKKTRSLPKLDSNSLKTIAKHAINLHHKKLMPIKLEFRIVNKKLTVTDYQLIDHAQETATPSSKATISVGNMHLISKGLPSAPGIVSAPARVIKANSRSTKIDTGEIIITDHASAHVIPHFKSASGIITELGGPTSHAAIIAREIGCPAVTSATQITKKVKTGDVITLNGNTGEIFRGGLPRVEALKLDTAPATPPPPSADTRTATKVFVSVSDANSIRLASSNFDGVGLLRGDIILANYGHHPKSILKSASKKRDFTDYLTDTIAAIANHHPSQPTIYWPSNLYSHHYQQLKGAAHYEPAEPNPALGYHGAARIIADPSFFELELKVLKTLQTQQHFHHLYLTLPFVRTTAELASVKKIIASNGLSRHSHFKIYLNLETPASILNLHAHIKSGIDGVIINTNLLTTLITGYDPNNHEVNQFYNQSDPAVIEMIQLAALVAQDHQLTCYIHGQLLQNSDIYKHLVSWGVDGVIVNPNQVDTARAQLANQELLKVSSS